MPAAAVVAVVANIAVTDVVAAAVTDAVVGTALGETLGVIGTDLLASTAAGAVAGGLSAGVTGGDIAQGIFTGGLASGVSGAINASGVGGEITNKISDTLGVSPKTAQILTNSGTKFLTGTGTGLAMGQDLGSAAKGGLLGATSSALGDYLVGNPSSNSFADKAINAAERQAINLGVNTAFGDTSRAPSTSYGSSPSTVATTGQSGSAAGSQALAQALNVGDPGTSLSGETGGKYKNVWNQASLKNPNEDLGTQNG